MDYWFTGDTHWGHSNIIEYCNRPFKSVEEMDRVLIDNWNKKVGKDDIVIHLGDFCFKTNPISQLNGRVILIRGNHDNRSFMKTIIESMDIFWGGRDIHLNHYPSNIKQRKINFVGHAHERWKVKYEYSDTLKIYPIVNVGVDVWNYEPVSLIEIFSYIGKESKEKV